MATNKKITQLDELTPATWADDDVIAIVDISAQETKKIQLSTFRGAVTGVSSLNASTPLTVDSATGDVTISVAINGGGTINAVFDEDNMASNSPTALSTQQSIKAYVDSQIITVDSLSEVLALGNTSGGTNLIVSSGDVLTTNTINETTAASGVTIETVLIKDGLVDDRDVSVDGTKLDTVETSADVTDATNVLAALVGQEVVATGFTGTLDGVLGGGTPAAITGTALTLTTGATVTTVLDEDNMASNSATALATQQSIKAYVDSQVGTVDTLAEILASGNTSGGTNIVVSSGDVITTNTINETTAASGVTIDSLLVKDGGITAAGTSTFAGQTITDLGAVTTADINGGTIDGTVIGGSSAAAGTFTTFTSTGINDDATSTAITINSSENVGIGTSSPSYRLHISNGSSTGTAMQLQTTGSGHNFDMVDGTGTARFRNVNGEMRLYGDLNTGGNGNIIFSPQGTAERMRIDSSGNLGIGNAAPSYLLDLYKSASTVARVRNTAATGGTPSTTHGEFVIESTDANMGMEFLGSTTADQRILFSDTAANSGQIVYNHTSNYMALFTATAERMRIDSSGNLGIGTTAPSQKLTIQGTDARIYLIGANTDINMTGTADGQLSLDGNGYGFGIALNSSGANLYTNTASRALIFGTDETERMRITGTGNVGIGTSSPDYQLDVSGTTDPRIILQSTGTASTDDTIFMNRVGGTTATNQIWFGDSGSAATGKLQYDHSNNAMTFHTNGGTERVRIDSSGNVGIATTSSVGSDSTSQGFWFDENEAARFSRASNLCSILNRITTTGTVQSLRYNGAQVGSISVTASATAYNTSSDYRLKENVVNLSGAIDRVKLLKPSRFNFIADPDTTVDGFVAHEVSDIVPEAVHGEKDAVDADGNPEYQGIDQSKLVPLLTAALKEALTKIDSLETRITALEG